MERINVTKTFLPPKEEYQEYLDRIWQSGQLTNQGPLLQEFESEIKNRLSIQHFHFVTNGTLAIQIALKSLGITGGEVITTPFSYVASTSAILWENCNPVFVDIDPQSLCMDPGKIEAAITNKTKAILPVHVFGNPCDIDAIEKIAQKHNLPVIYDGAHAYGVTYQGRPLLDNGDITICSFHATKLFHTIEGGGLVIRESEISKTTELIKRFGHTGDQHYRLGINAKASEFQAAMGLCNLNYIDSIIAARKLHCEQYTSRLAEKYARPSVRQETQYNYSYYPIIFESNAQLENVVEELHKVNVFPRRYFYPSLNTLAYLKEKQDCPISEDISQRILCLPLYFDLEESIIDRICEVVLQ